LVFQREFNKRKINLLQPQLWSCGNQKL
jgi:hypothetical protein